MRVLQINLIYKDKSTGRTCLELDRFLNANGIESITAYGHGEKTENAFRINNKFEYFFHNIMSRITGLEGFFSFFPTLRLIRFCKKYKPDVVHLRNLHGHFLNFPLFFSYLSKNKITTVLNVHDCWCFTGKCSHYTVIQCEKWKTACHHCPKKREYPQSLFFDLSKKMHNLKKKWFGNIPNLAVISNSKWTASQVAQSFLKNRKQYVVYNWIDLDTFRYTSSDILRKYNVDDDRFKIICVSASWTKGSPRYNDMLKLADSIDDDKVMILVGQSEEEIKHKRIVYIPFVSNTRDLAKLYSAADCYVHLSLEDTFGKVIAEAQSCGTPAIVYASTGCKEIVNDGVTGYVVEPGNVEKIVEKIYVIQSKGRDHYSYNCRKWTENNFEMKKNCQQIVSIYSEILRDGKNE